MIRATQLQTEYLKEPIGIDFVHPRLFWNCEGAVNQTAYQIEARDDQDNILWNSGKVTNRSMHSDWGGKPIPPKTRVLWKVRLWDEADACGDWQEASLETGIDEWSATWITGNYRIAHGKRYPVDCFRKCFDAESVAKARLYITACGLYEAKLNGRRCGEFVFAPGYTDYRKRIQYQTIDVTKLLTVGKNTLTVALADGWYRGSCGAWGLKNQYGTETKLLAQLELIYADGKKQVIVTDESWDWSNDGPIRFADNKDGEIVDANFVPTYTHKAKKTQHKITPTASNNVPVTEHEHFEAKLFLTPSGKTVLDFGQNIAGYVSFRLNARLGQKLTLCFGEMLDKDGEFTQANIQLSKGKKTTPLQKVEYTCSEGVNEYKTTFAIFGFQYVLVESDVAISSADFTAIAVYSDMKQTGFFQSSHELLNRLVDATVWSAKGNHLDIPTDCPTRERHGWTGDAQIFFESAAYLFDFAGFSQKYLRDIYDWQRKSGKLPHIVPDGGADLYMRTMNGSVGWSDVGILYPWRFAKAYEDERILKIFYPSMKKYAQFMIHRCGKKMPIFAEKIKLSKENQKYLVNSGQSYGEWSEPADICAFHWTDFCAPHPEVSTAYTAYIMKIMAEVAEKYGTVEEATRFRDYHEGCKRAYQELVATNQYSLDTDRQARLVRPLAMALLTEKQTEFAQKRLLGALDAYGWRLGTGFLSTPLILDVLTDIDVEAAYRLLENEKIPGWLAMPRLGATTIWESWEGPFNSQGAGAGSLNHYSKGAVCAWLFKTMCGIQVNGENHFLVAPKPGGHFQYARAKYQSIYGIVSSGWKKSETGYTLDVEIPANTAADIYLPDGTHRRVGAGQHHYEWTCP